MNIKIAHYISAAAYRKTKPCFSAVQRSGHIREAVSAATAPYSRSTSRNTPSTGHSTSVAVSDALSVFYSVSVAGDRTQSVQQAGFYAPACCATRSHARIGGGGHTRPARRSGPRDMGDPSTRRVARTRRAPPRWPAIGFNASTCRSADSNQTLITCESPCYKY